MGKRSSQQLFGDIVRTLRQSKGLSQEALADRAGLHRTYISLLERGLRNPSLTVIQQLAAALKVRLVDLVKDLDVRSDGSSK